MSRAKRGGLSSTVLSFSMTIPWYSVSIHGLCLLAEQRRRVCVGGEQGGGETKEALGQSQQLGGTKRPVFKRYIMAEATVRARVRTGTTCMRVCVCALVDRVKSRWQPPPPLPCALLVHTDRISSITLCTSVAGSVIKASLILPYHTQRAILLISISHTDLPRAGGQSDGQAAGRESHNGVPGKKKKTAASEQNARGLL